MNKIIQVLNLKNPEGFQGTFKGSKFNKFKKYDLKEFVKKNYLQTRSSVILKKEEQIQQMKKPSKKLLICLCVQIEFTRSILFRNDWFD
tara:strand:+ start:355 stop:621 length:267 start_codon:yes stop_codon:yes gene_type:complete